MRWLPLLVLVSACASPPPPRPRLIEPQPTPPPPPPAVVPPPPPVAHLPSDPCPKLGPNEVSNDETPAIAGTKGRAKAGDWLDARGITKQVFRGFVKSRNSQMLEDFDADSIFDTDDSCQTLTVGDKNEDALVCTLAIRTSIMRYSAIAFVVRNKRIAAVFEAGYSLPSMDWPGSSWLDLQVAFSANGQEVDVRDRAPAGSVLVPAPSDCHKYFAQYLVCEKARQEGAPDPDPTCPQITSPTPPVYPMDDDESRTQLHGCAAALPGLDQLVRESSGGGPFASEFKGDRDFGIRACKARGHYAWKNDRFLRVP